MPLQILFGVIFLMLSACASVDSLEEVPTATSVDLSRYAGKWYEVARLPMWAQRDCLRSTAEYTVLLSGKIGVRNACITSDGKEKNIQGVAAIVDQTHHAKLNVVFDQWAAKLVSFFSSSDEGNYWILRVDPEYRHAVVGTPDREYLWILSRTPQLPESTYQELVAFSQRLGFTTGNLIRSAPYLRGNET
ncbi:MAG: lipocalin family protein [Nitrospirales bacterium]